MYSSKLNSSIDQNNMILPFQIRFENALKEVNILTKCRFLMEIIQEFFSHNIKEIHYRYVLLIENIFSYHISFGSNNWRLKSLTKETHPKEFEAIYYLLYTDGPLFKLIRHLINDTNNRYEFPISYLPEKSFGRGFISNFCLNKMSTPTNLSLNAFEFFMFHFACYITKENISNSLYFDSSNIENTNVLYYVLLENYLEFFIPIYNVSSILKNTEMKDNSSSNEKSSLWKSLSSTTTNFLNLSSNKHASSSISETITSNSLFEKNEKKFITKVPLFSENVTKTSMLNSKIFTFSKFQQNLNIVDDTLTNDIIGTVLYKCETVLGIFAEIWFSNYYSDDDKTHLKMVPNTFNITIEHMRVIRILIKHLHYFVNSFKNKYGELMGSETQYNSGGFVSSNLNDPLDEIKRNLWTAKYPIQKNLYIFLRMIFDCWPNDSSFRVPLETWLSYIQPWRYIPGKSHSNEIVTTDLFEWKRFISENIFFYTTLFRHVITRMSKQLDLNSTNNSLLVYRVFKVFAQNHLKDCLKEAEINFLNALDITSYSRSNLSYNSLLPSIRHQVHNSPASNKNSLIDSVQLSSEYVSIFSSVFRDQIIELSLKIAKSLYIATESSKETNKNDNMELKSYFDVILNLFIQNKDSIVSNKKNIDVDKIRNHLNASIEFISLIFDIPQQSIDTILSNARKVSNTMNIDNMNGNENEKKIYNIVDGIPKLTEFGRNQILNGNLKLDYAPRIIEGNPDTQPVRSYEVAFLVKFALFLSTIIDKKFGKLFSEYYKQNNLCGTLARLILSPPITYTRYEKKNNLNSEIVIEHLPPRINLRFMASIDFMFCSFIFILMTCFYLMDSVLTYFLLTFITFLLYLLLKIR